MCSFYPASLLLLKCHQNAPLPSQVRVRRRIGEGGFAFVYAVEQSDDGRPMALKRLLAADAEKRKQTVQECSIHQDLDYTWQHFIKSCGKILKQHPILN